MAVLGFEGVISNGENTLRNAHDGGEGGHGEEDEGGGGQQHVPRVQNDRHAEEDIGEQPATKRRPVKTGSHFQLLLILTTTCSNWQYVKTL